MRSLTLSQIRERHVTRGRPVPGDLWAELVADPRPGARAVVLAIERIRHDHRAEGQRLRRMLRRETGLIERGLRFVAGVDEAGMSPLAGPVAAAAVVFAPGVRIPHVDDSKRLDARTRERLAPLIREQALAWAVAFVEPEEIDRINIYRAGLLAMRRAVLGLGVRPDHLLVDGRRIPGVTIPQDRIVHGDRECFSIAAASILAKTARDARMRELDRLYPGYGFARHKGYPVAAHAEALVRLGPCPLHRRSFARVKEAQRSATSIASEERRST